MFGKNSMDVNMLRKFVAGQRGAVDTAMQAHAAGDWETAVRTAHTTKGVCGNIGDSGVQALADKLRAALDPLVDAVAAWLPPDPSQSTAAVTIDEGALERVTSQLRSLCEEMDSGAEDVCSQYEALLRAAYPTQAAAIAEAIRGFDFDQAIEQLDTAWATRKG